MFDLVAIRMGATICAASQLAALRSEFERRGQAWPDRFVVPDETTWQSGYEAEARRSFLTTAVTLNKAVAVRLLGINGPN